ncbi:hypothetical protein BDW66DRAFT_61663 [Aspergillus desertorum]
METIQTYIFCSRSLHLRFPFLLLHLLAFSSASTQVLLAYIPSAMHPLGRTASYIYNRIDDSMHSHKVLTVYSLLCYANIANIYVQCTKAGALRQSNPNKTETRSKGAKQKGRRSLKDRVGGREDRDESYADINDRPLYRLGFNWHTHHGHLSVLHILALFQHHRYLIFVLSIICADSLGFRKEYMAQRAEEGDLR